MNNKKRESANSIEKSHIARLLVQCPDRPGIVAATSGFLRNHNANIIQLDQHSTATAGGTFFMRLEFHAESLGLSKEAFEKNFQEVVGTPFEMHYSLTYASQQKVMVPLVSKFDHALLEILWRYRRGELPCKIPFVISNHENLREDVESLGIEYHHIKVTKETKPEAEAKILELTENKADLLVLARYMQIVSPEFVSHFTHRIINIHHSFLPAFVGANPYERAAERGVKLIGATSHYVTAELDAGPIIEQDVIRVSHRHSAKELKALGRDIERQVFARAIKWHLEDRIIVDGNKTVVFN